jgi:acylphosphatase
MNVSYIAHVSGKVQGVFFRASSQQVAIDCGLSGYVRNLADGDVEVLISGEQDNVDKMLEWLEHGPPDAKVANLKKTKVKYNPQDFFSIS